MGGGGGFLKAVAPIALVSSMVMQGASAHGAAKSARKKRKFFESQAEYDRYQRKLIRKAQEAEAERKFQTATKDYNERVGTINKWVEYWGDIEESPGTEHPGFENYKREAERESKATRESLADTLRRRGVTGGRQEKLETEAAESLSSQLAKTLIGISKEAKGKQLELEMMRPNRPVKLAYGSTYPQYPQLTAQYTGEPSPIAPADFSGLGMLAAVTAGQGAGKAQDPAYAGSISKGGSMTPDELRNYMNFYQGFTDKYT